MIISLKQVDTVMGQYTSTSMVTINKTYNRFTKKKKQQQQQQQKKGTKIYYKRKSSNCKRKNKKKKGELEKSTGKQGK